VSVCYFVSNDGNNYSIPPTLDGWVYIEPIHGPLDGPLYTWAQYTPTPLYTWAQYTPTPLYTWAQYTPTVSLLSLSYPWL
jgi:hypothetical protein